MKTYSFSTVDVKILTRNNSNFNLQESRILSKIIFLQKYRLKTWQESSPAIKILDLWNYFSTKQLLDPPDFRFFICSAFLPPTPLFRFPTNHLIWPGTSPGIIARTRAYDGVRVSACVPRWWRRGPAGSHLGWRQLMPSTQPRNADFLVAIAALLFYYSLSFPPPDPPRCCSAASFASPPLHIRFSLHARLDRARSHTCIRARTRVIHAFSPRNEARHPSRYI